jgi:hypothetical protein
LLGTDTSGRVFSEETTTVVLSRHGAGIVEWKIDLDCTLECSLCHRRQVVQQSEIEADAYAIAEGILRHCESCGNSTIWRRAADDGVPPGQPAR